MDRVHKADRAASALSTPEHEGSRQRLRAILEKPDAETPQKVESIRAMNDWTGEVVNGERPGRSEQQSD